MPARPESLSLCCLSSADRRKGAIAKRPTGFTPILPDPKSRPRLPLLSRTPYSKARSSSPTAHSSLVSIFSSPPSGIESRTSFLHGAFVSSEESAFDLGMRAPEQDGASRRRRREARAEGLPEEDGFLCARNSDRPRPPEGKKKRRAPRPKRPKGGDEAPKEEEGSSPEGMRPSRPPMRGRVRAYAHSFQMGIEPLRLLGEKGALPPPAVSGLAQRPPVTPEVRIAAAAFFKGVASAPRKAAGRRPLDRIHEELLASFATDAASGRSTFRGLREVGTREPLTVKELYFDRCFASVFCGTKFASKLEAKDFDEGAPPPGGEGPWAGPDLVRPLLESLPCFGAAEGASGEGRKGAEDSWSTSSSPVAGQRATLSRIEEEEPTEVLEGSRTTDEEGASPRRPRAEWAPGEGHAPAEVEGGRSAIGPPDDGASPAGGKDEDEWTDFEYELSGAEKRDVKASGAPAAGSPKEQQPHQEESAYFSCTFFASEESEDVSRPTPPKREEDVSGSSSSSSSSRFVSVRSSSASSGEDLPFLDEKTPLVTSHVLGEGSEAGLPSPVDPFASDLPAEAQDRLLPPPPPPARRRPSPRAPPLPVPPKRTRRRRRQDPDPLLLKRNVPPDTKIVYVVHL